MNRNEVDTIRKVDLTLRANQKYKVIKKLVETGGNKQRAALTLGCSLRHVYRLIHGYQTQGKSFFLHGNLGRKPAHTLPDELKQRILTLYQTKYFDTNLTHFQELLAEREGISVSVSTISSLLGDAFILSPKAKRSSRKAMKKKLKTLQSKTKQKKEKILLQKALLSLDEAHPRRPRCAYFGEMLQMDASVHPWFGGYKTHLHIAVDDATGQITGAFFDHQETLNGYYHVLHQVMKNYGVPYQFFTDNRTVFEYKLKKCSHVEEDTFTQFGYACKQLGIEIKTSSVAQAKGRVERMFQSLQSRLCAELRLADVTSIEQANEFLVHYIKKYNKAFAFPLDSIKSVFEKQPSDEKMNLLLAVLCTRKIDNGSCIKYQNKYYLPVDKQGKSVHYRKGTKALVIQSFDGTLYSSIGEQVYALEHLKENQKSSGAFDLTQPVQVPKKRYIPPMSHPWKQASFEKYMAKQKHRQKKETEVSV